MPPIGTNIKIDPQLKKEGPMNPSGLLLYYINEDMVSGHVCMQFLAMPGKRRMPDDR